MSGEVFVNEETVSARWKRQIESLKADIKAAEAMKSRPRIIQLKEQLSHWETALQALETTGASLGD